MLGREQLVFLNLFLDGLFRDFTQLLFDGGLRVSRLRLGQRVRMVPTRA
jgi:hypothetical protein